MAALAGAGIAALAGLVLGAYWLFILALAAIYALASLSLVVLTGWSGQLNLHVAALGLGLGAYAALALVAFGVPPLAAVLAAGLLTVPLAGIVAYAAVRFRGLELAVATLALGAIFEALFFRNIGKVLGRKLVGGTTEFQSAFVPIPRPQLGTISFDSDRGFYFFTIVVVGLLLVVVANLGRASTGRTMRAIREREVMAETAGVPVLRYRVGAFIISILLASTAGALFATWNRAVAPDSFKLDLSFQLLAGVVIGGIVSPAGALIGGGLVALFTELVRSGPLSIFAGERSFVVFGVGMVLVLWLRPDGLVGLARRRAERRRAEAEAAVAAEVAVAAPAGMVIEAAPLPRPAYRSKLDRHLHPSILRVDDARISFGGVVALDGVSLTVAEGEVCALIGPNGAGKSTLFNCIGGLLTPDRGRIYFRGRDVTELDAHRRASLGMGRTFQSIEAFRRLTVLENLMVAGHRLRTAGVFAEAFGLPAARRSERALRDQAREILATLGLEAVADVRPSELPLGLLRVLEVGMALAPGPRLLLLDEPSAGLDIAETASLSALIGRVRATYGIAALLVEHDMAMVGTLAEHVYVLDFGSIIAEGTPQEVRRNPDVLERYLGASAAAFVPDDPGAGPTADGKRARKTTSDRALTGGRRAR